MAKKTKEPDSGSVPPADPSDQESGELIDPPMAMVRALLICAGGWLVPGGSHVVLGRWIRGGIFAAAIVVMFVLGLGMQGRLYGLPPQETLHLFAFIADVGVGLPYMIADGLGYGAGVLSSPNYDYGTTFLWVAGLLNYLIVLDAFDISQGRKP